MKRFYKVLFDFFSIEYGELNKSGYDQDFKVRATVNDEGRFLAVVNDYLAFLKPFQKPVINTFSGKALLIVQSSESSDCMSIAASAIGLENTELIIGTN